MLNLKCKLCKENISNLNHFWKTHKISQKSYFEKHFPRYDLHTKEQICYEDYDQYFLNDFKTRINIKNFIQSNPPEQIKNYCAEYLTRRKNIKQILFAPSQVELKSLIAPTLHTYHKFSNYNDICDQLGLLKRFELQPPPDEWLTSISKTIYLDTREQNALIFPSNIKTYVETLSYGDYTTQNSNYFIERKSLFDFVGTFGRGFDRFCREVERAEKDNKYLFVLVENSLSKALSFDYLPEFKRKVGGKMKASPSWIFSNVRKCMQSFSNIQFIFCNDRDDLIKMILILLNGKKWAEYDCQYLKELKRFSFQSVS